MATTTNNNVMKDITESKKQSIEDMTDLQVMESYNKIKVYRNMKESGRDIRGMRINTELECHVIEGSRSDFNQYWHGRLVKHPEFEVESLYSEEYGMTEAIFRKLTEELDWGMERKLEATRGFLKRIQSGSIGMPENDIIYGVLE